MDEKTNENERTNKINEQANKQAKENICKY